jgi:hypothetical protein
MVNDWPAGTNATLGRQTLTDQARRYVLPVEVARAQAREAPKSPVPAPGEVDAAPWSGETRFEVGRYSVGRRVSFDQFSSRVKAVEGAATGRGAWPEGHVLQLARTSGWGVQRFVGRGNPDRADARSSPFQYTGLLPRERRGRFCLCQLPPDVWWRPDCVVIRQPSAFSSQGRARPLQAGLENFG